jgi:thiopeptide-type bacteriocin biosynthesis protein
MRHREIIPTDDHQTGQPNRRVAAQINLTQGHCRQGLFGRLEVAEYEREVERYGGEKGIALAESFFTLSSKFAVAQLLLERQSVEKEIAGRLLSVVCSVDRLLAGSGLTAAQRMTFCDRHTARSRAGAEVYRRAAGRVYEALVEVQDIDHSAAEDAGQLANFVRSGHALRLLAGDSSDADAEMRELLSSYIHMHCNRLLRSRDDEAVAIDLLRRGLMTMRARAGV